MQEFRIKCLKCIQPIGEFYVGVINSDDLVKITFADVHRLETGTEMRDVEVYSGIQRELSKNRVKEIEQYVNNVDATFPTSIILNINIDDIIGFDEKTSELILPYKDNIAKILDGQHRIAGLDNFSGSLFQLNVTIFVEMELEDQAIVFSTINITQTKVNKSIVSNLYEFAVNRSPNKTAHNIIRALNKKEGSPFENKIKILGTAVDKNKETITQATFSEKLMNLFSKDTMKDRDTFKRGITPSKFEGADLKNRPLRNIFIEGDDGKIAKIIFEYFKAVEQRWPEAWRVVEPEMILNKSTGFLALMNLFKDLYVHFEKIGEVITAEQYKPYFDSVILKDLDFNRTKYIPGSGGQSQLYKDLKSQMGI